MKIGRAVLYVPVKCKVLRRFLEQKVRSKALSYIIRGTPRTTIVEGQKWPSIREGVKKLASVLYQGREGLPPSR